MPPLLIPVSLSSKSPGSDTRRSATVLVINRYRYICLPELDERPLRTNGLVLLLATGDEPRAQRAGVREEPAQSGT